MVLVGCAVTRVFSWNCFRFLLRDAKVSHSVGGVKPGFAAATEWNPTFHSASRMSKLEETKRSTTATPLLLWIFASRPMHTRHESYLL